MNIINYCSFFHDGSIIEITHFNHKIELSMESAQISREDLKEQIFLSNQSTLKGKLHIEQIYSIEENKQPFEGKLHRKSDWGEIIHLKTNPSQTKILIRWVYLNFKSEEISNLNIKAKKIWWENIPDLKDPFW